ncbi:peptidase inhibitor family I36 protein [Streptomyces sp. NPDC001914]|uniref:peptidase inhibitor family I36 protein n=1 Tax=Streptomyces sp. NPDC001914 TaxID=3364623 RepID=UPI0036922F21
MHKMIYVGIAAVTAALMSTPATAGTLGHGTAPSAGKRPVSGLLSPDEETRLHKAVAADDEARGGVIADYNGKKINLAEGWQGAQVCGEDPDTGEAKCWDSVEDSNRDAADAAHASPSTSTSTSTSTSASATKTAKGKKTAMAAAARPAAAPADGDTGDGTGDDYTDDATGDGGSTTPAPDQPEPAGPGSGIISKLYTACPAGNVCLWADAGYKGRMLKFPTHDTAKTRHLSEWGFRDKTSSAYVNRPQRGVECYDIRTGQPDPHLFLGAGYSLYKNFKGYDYPWLSGGGNWNDKVDAIKY